MKIIDINDPGDFRFPPMVFAVGGFDGLHRGHELIINTVIGHAKDQGLESALISFDPIPKAYFSDSKYTQLLTTKFEKIRRINHKFALDYLIFLAFNQNFANLSYTDFIERYLVQLFNAREVVLGKDHNFGKDARGNPAGIETLGIQFGFKVTIVDTLIHDQKPIKSSRIRNLIEEGEMEIVNQMLGYPYTLTEKVQPGRKIGRKLGYPTINFNLDYKKAIPGDGVYLISSLLDGKRFYGMMYIGESPTMGKVDRHGEIHFLELDREIQPAKLRLEIYKKIREDMYFDSTGELVKQIDRDKERALNLIVDLDLQ